MKVVLDTNVIVSGIFWRGILYKILNYWIKGRFELLITEYIIKEYERTLVRISKGKNKQLVNMWLILIANNSLVIRIKKRIKLSEDPDDDKFIECAMAGNAFYIVSGDAHLLNIGKVKGISILLLIDSPNAFVTQCLIYIEILW